MPSRLEPAGLSRSDGKRPDGVTLAPWKSGQLLVWDATCPDTLAPSYRAHATQEAGKVAERAEERKVEKYRCLPASHLFCPVAIETLGAVGPQSLALIKDIGLRIASETKESRAGEYMLQRLSVVVYREETLWLCWGLLGFDCYIITSYLFITISMFVSIITN